MPLRLLALSDIHGKISSLRAILEKVTSLPVDLVAISGDISHFSTGDEELRSILEVVEGLGPPYCYVLGNCDPPDFSRGVGVRGTCLESNCLAHGLYDIIGAGGATPTPFGTPFEVDEASIIASLDRGLSGCQGRDGRGLIVVSHNPPRGETVDRTRVGSHVGSLMLRDYILEKKPLLVLTGHIHEAVGHEMIGQTTVLNPGPVHRGSYALVEIGEGGSVHVSHGSA